MVFYWSREGGGYEVSSAGDSRFSAFRAYLPGGRSIEEVYQCDVKGYDPGGTFWRRGKGKPPLDPAVDRWNEYLKLWQMWARHNPILMDDLRKRAGAAGGGLADKFAKTPVNQANALAHILNEVG